MHQQRSPYRKHPLGRLPVRVALFVLVAVVARGAVMGTVSFQGAHGLLQRLVEQTFPLLADQTTSRVDSWLGLGQGEVAAAAGRPAMTRALRRLRSPQAALRDSELAAVLAHALKEATLLDGLWLTDARGTLLHSVGEPPVAPESFSAESWRERVEPISAGGQERVLVATAPLPDRQGGNLAWLHGRLDPGGLRALLPHDSLSTMGSAYVVDGGGVALFTATGDSAVGDQPLPAKALARERGVTTHAGASGDSVLGVARPLANLDGYVAVVSDPDKGFGPVAQLLVWVGALDLALLLLIAWGAYRYTSRLVPPIEALWEVAHRVAQGDYDVDVPDTQRSDEIGELTRTFNAMTRKLHENQTEIEAAHRQLLAQNDALQSANEVLAQLSVTDGLTKLHNHRFFQEHLVREIKRVNRTGDPLCMLLVDIDDFKQLNDRLGHAVGDAVLVSIAQILSGSVRESDLLARYGGEEFVVLTTGTDFDGAVSLAEKIRMEVGEATVGLDDDKRPVYATVSIGVARYKGDRRAFFGDADRALYRAKAEGKNCVIADDGP